MMNQRKQATVISTKGRIRTIDSVVLPICLHTSPRRKRRETIATLSERHLTQQSAVLLILLRGFLWSIGSEKTGTISDGKLYAPLDPPRLSSAFSSYRLSYP